MTGVADVPRWAIRQLPERIGHLNDCAVAIPNGRKWPVADRRHATPTDCFLERKGRRRNQHPQPTDRFRLIVRDRRRLWRRISTVCSWPVAERRHPTPTGRLPLIAPPSQRQSWAHFFTGLVLADSHPPSAGRASRAWDASRLSPHCSRSTASERAMTPGKGDEEVGG